MIYSNQWKRWKAFIDLKTCLTCKDNNGKIYSIHENVYPRPPLHPNCRCIIERLKAIIAGNATLNGRNGADWHLKYYGRLPTYYISRGDAYHQGWKPRLGNLSKVAPGKMMYGGIYRNDDGKLPQTSGRIWYEADINYQGGRRNDKRVLFANDGLIFVTYDHYNTFEEII